MKVLFLAAGYGTRLYPITVNQPKPLLPIAGKPIIEHLVKKIEPIKHIKEAYVVTNNKYFSFFEDWGKNLQINLDVSILNDGTNSEEEKLGAVKDIYFAIKEKNIDDDLLIIGGDNLFEFNLEKMLSYFLKKQKCLIGIYDVREKELAKRYGVVSLDDKFKITSFKEKPNIPETSLIATCIYVLPKNYLKHIENYLARGKELDAPGYLMKWITEMHGAFGYIFEEEWYDIGTKESYEKAMMSYEAKLQLQ